MNGANVGNLRRLYGSSSGGGTGPTGPPGPPGSTTPESFSVTLSQNYVYPGGSGWEPISVLYTDAIDTGLYPDTSLSVCFSNLNSGSFDFSNGTFTVGTTGNYIYDFGIITTPYIALKINNEFIFYPEGPLPNSTWTGILHLNTGDVVRLYTIANVNYIASAGSPAGNDCPNLLWSMSLVGGIQGITGPTGAPGGSTSTGDSFCIMLAEDWNYPGVFPALETVTNWRDTLDPLAVANPAGSIFNNVVDGTLNLAAGTYTCGKAGVYFLSLYASGGVGCFSINGYTPVNQLISVGSYTSFLVNLEVGDVVTVSNQGYNQPVPALEESFQDPDNPGTYLLSWANTWGLCYMGGGGGGSSGSSTNEAFMIALPDSWDSTLTGEYEKVTGWTATNTLGSNTPKSLFNNISAGTLDVTNGTFTCGITGTYLVTGNQINSFALTIRLNGDDTQLSVTDGSPSILMLNLITGDVVDAVYYSESPGGGLSGPAAYTPPYPQIYRTTWGMSLIG